MDTQIISLPSYDGYPLNARLCLPDGKETEKIVLYVNGSGPQTYTTKRQLPDGRFFNYFDIFADEFTARGIGFCSYSQRGVRDGDMPPYFVEIDEQAYQQYRPSISVPDIEHIAAYLHRRCPRSRLILLGWSEGTILAPLVAHRGNVKISALMLAGYCNENLYDILTWQLSGNTVLTQYRRLFDVDRKGYVTEADFIEDPYGARRTLFGEQTFSDLDLDKDGAITVADTRPVSIDHLRDVLDAIERKDDEWLKNNHRIRLTAGWFQEHFALKPTKEILPQLDLPIHVFAGEFDPMTPLEQARAIDAEFKRLGKSNLHLHVFENHDHELNFVKYLLKGEHSEGMKAIFHIAEKL